MIPQSVRIVMAHRHAFAPGVHAVGVFSIVRHLFLLLAEIVVKIPPRVTTTEQDEQLIERLRSGPALMLTAHFGNWELLARYGVARGAPFIAIAREARIAFFQKILARFRREIPILWRRGPTLGAVADQLSKGKWVAALIDQDLHARSERVDGFGLRCAAPSTLVELAFRQRAPVLAVFMARERWGVHRLLMRELDTTGGVSAVLSQYQRALREAVDSYPNQWMWFHKRWRSTPSERIPGKAYVSYLNRIVPLGEPFIVVHADRLSTSKEG